MRYTMLKKKYKEWTRIPWDGNTELGYECWRKSFGGVVHHSSGYPSTRFSGHVSVGIGEFKSIVYSYGPNHSESLSGTRYRVKGLNGDRHETEEEAMSRVDRNRGLHNHLDNPWYK
jgi:hypothetical protein